MGWIKKVRRKKLMGGPPLPCMPSTNPQPAGTKCQQFQGQNEADDDSDDSGYIEEDFEFDFDDENFEWEAVIDEFLEATDPHRHDHDDDSEEDQNYITELIMSPYADYLQ